MILDLDSLVVWKNNQEVEVLGKVEDVMGNIDQPFYRVGLDYYII
jgi:rRNA processing protein Gar1